MAMEQSSDMTSAFESALSSAEAASTSAASADTPAAVPSGTVSESGETNTEGSSQPPVAATAQPTPDATGEQPPQTPPSSAPDAPDAGQPPAWRWQDILSNTRETVAKETEARVRSEYDWATRIDPDYRELAPQAIQLAKWIDTDPEAALQWLESQVRPVSGGTNGRSAAPTRAEAAPAPTGDTPPGPDAQIQAPDGSFIPVYTPEGMARREQWFEHRLKSQLAPVDEIVRERRIAAQARQAYDESMAWAADVVSPLKELPHFDEFKPELAKVVQGFGAQMSSKEMASAIRSAYTRLYNEKVKSVTTNAEQAAISTLRQRAVAGAVTPASGAGTGAKPTFVPGERGFADALRHFSGVTQE